MDADAFTEKLQKLIDEARSSKKISLDELTGLIDVELEGLNMALAEGEEF